MTEKRKPGRPVGTKRVNPETAKDQNATFTIRKDLLEKIKLCTVVEQYRLTIEAKKVVPFRQKDILNRALEEFFDKYEKKYGKL